MERESLGERKMVEGEERRRRRRNRGMKEGREAQVREGGGGAGRDR